MTYYLNPEMTWGLFKGTLKWPTQIEQMNTKTSQSEKKYFFKIFKISNQINTHTSHILKWFEKER